MHFVPLILTYYFPVKVRINGDNLEAVIVIFLFSFNKVKIKF